jgi:hypothetical protein
MPATLLSSSTGLHTDLVAPVASDTMEEQQASENLTSLASSEERERKQFMNDINKFMIEIGKPLSKIPIMGYKELDLFQLFKEVCAYGGFNEVVKNVGTWSKIWKRLGNFDPSITDSSFRLKKNYERYLLEYEYKCYPDHKLQAFELEKQIQLKKSQQHQQLYQATAVEPNSPSSPTSSFGSPLTSLKQTKKTEKLTGKKFTSAPSTPSATNPSSPPLKRKSSSLSLSKDVVRGKDGTPKFPLVLGELSVESIGTIIPQPPYISEKHVWPVGFSSTRYFSSMINPELRVKYTSQIVDAGDKPQFVVTASDDLTNPVVSNSPSGAWRTVLKRVMAKSGSNDERTKNVSVSGTLRFGLAHPVVSSLIRELPDSEKCREYMLSCQSTSVNRSPDRKRKNTDSGSESNSSDDDFAADWLATSKKQPKYDAPSSPSSSSDEEFSLNEYDLSQEELHDLESAVSVLHALKYCTVY